MCLILLFLFVTSVTSLPATWIQKISENFPIQDVDNYLPKIGDVPRNDVPIFVDSKAKRPIYDNITLTTDSTTNLNTGALTIDPILESDNNTLNSRPMRQEEMGNATNKPNEFEKQEDGSSEEEGGNMITQLISTLLGQLSRPDGSIDVEAITDLLGSLIIQRPDGTYDFSGVTDLLRGFFGGDDGGGSDIGAFLGGIAGAFLQGVANPPGAKGVGILTGNLLSGILPSLSALPPNEDGETPPGSDPIGFVAGFLKSFLAGNSAYLSANGSSLNSSGNYSGGGNKTDGSQKGGSKFSVIKAVISGITSILTASSGASSSKGGENW